MVLRLPHLACSAGNMYCQNPSGWVWVDPFLLSPPGFWFCKNLSVHTFRNPVFRASLHISLLLIQCQGAHGAVWYLKALTGTTICFVWHKICCKILWKYWFLQPLEFSGVRSIYQSYFAFCIGHTAALFRMIPSCRKLSELGLHSLFFCAWYEFVSMGFHQVVSFTVHFPVFLLTVYVLITV